MPSLNDKNILIIPNTGTANTPTMVFTGSDGSTTSPSISATMNYNNGGTLAFSGLNGTLFSVNNAVTGTIWSVNDFSGIPVIEILDTGLIRLAPYNGQVNIGVLGTYVETLSTTTNITASVLSPDCSAGRNWYYALTANVTAFTPVNIPSVGVTTLTLFLPMGSTIYGWSASNIKWSGGTAPTMIANTTNIVSLVFIPNTNNNWMGFSGGYCAI